MGLVDNWDLECPAVCKVFYHEDWRVTVYRSANHFHLTPEFFVFNTNNADNGRRNSCMFCLYSGKHLQY
uniref:Uncharacterized protein n=1 Tax=Meloidogyne enterolobii TaxID=390850 RepID=A0A6V7UM69_MELEN|nr:unnamed protein product [Meloidogyne enterolobii]